MSSPAQFPAYYLKAHTFSFQGNLDKIKQQLNNKTKLVWEKKSSDEYGDYITVDHEGIVYRIFPEKEIFLLDAKMEKPKVIQQIFDRSIQKFTKTLSEIGATDINPTDSNNY